MNDDRAALTPSDLSAIEGVCAVHVGSFRARPMAREIADALNRSLAAGVHLGDEGHVHVVEYPSRCTGCEHLAAAFVAAAPDWMLADRGVHLGDEGLDVERLYRAVIEAMAILWGEPSDGISAQIRPILARQIVDRYAALAAQENPA